MAQGVPGRLRPGFFLTFGTTRMVGRQPYTPAVFTPGKIPGTHFQSRPQGSWSRREPRKKSPVTPPGIDTGTSPLVEQCLNHYATPGPMLDVLKIFYRHFLNFFAYIAGKLLQMAYYVTICKYYKVYISHCRGIISSLL